MATAHGIVVLDERPKKFSITARVLPDGEGHLFLKGRVTDSFPKTFGPVIAAIRKLSDLMELDMDSADITLRLETPHNYPLAGGSYALAAGMAILASADGKQIPNSNCYTGCIDTDGNVSAVADVHLKRRGAAGFGFSRFFLPRSQIDLFSTLIAQCPCTSLADAYGITFWNEK
jgi:predicted ATP-dependent serine protease